ncbi:hypothetical protein PENSPDRAFT_759457 [Peniophora sp. CONT]|nr:hypothetical protein PENSPDRAFT_759457 [Peniophora sp. CONT]
MAGEPLGESTGELRDLKRQVERLKRDNDGLRERLRFEERDHHATKADRDEDLLLAQQRYDALDALLQDALRKVQEERKERELVEERFRATMESVRDISPSEGSALSTPSPQRKKRAAEGPPALLDTISSNKKRKGDHNSGGDDEDTVFLVEEVELDDEVDEESGEKAEEEDEIGDGSAIDDEDPADDLDYITPPPQRMVKSLRALRKMNPDSVFNVVAWFGENGEGVPKWRVQCGDCSSMFCPPNSTHDHECTCNLAEHLQEEEHRQRVSARLEETKVRIWRHTLQKTFLVNPAGIVYQDILPAHVVLQAVENYDGMTARALKNTKISKVMRHIHLLEDAKIPDGDYYGFRKRARALVDKWKPLLEQDTMAETGGGATVKEP